MTVRAYNPSQSPVVIARSGHSLAGGEWGDVNERDHVGRSALKTELLTEDGLHWQDDGSELETDAEQNPDVATDPDAEQTAQPPETTTTPRRSRAGTKE